MVRIVAFFLAFLAPAVSAFAETSPPPFGSLWQIARRRER